MKIITKPTSFTRLATLPEYSEYLHSFPAIIINFTWLMFVLEVLFVKNKVVRVCVPVHGHKCKRVGNFLFGFTLYMYHAHYISIRVMNDLVYY